MATIPFQAEIIPAGALSFGRLPLLLATQTVPLLRDDVLEVLFSAYRVELFRHVGDLFDGRKSPVAFALLCGSAGAPHLALEAHIIRTQWPLARIIVLGQPPWQLEDYLYDHTVQENCSPAMLTNAFEANSVDLWNYSAARSSGRDGLPRWPAESDPSKAKPSGMAEVPVPSPWDSPEGEQANLWAEAYYKAPALHA